MSKSYRIYTDFGGWNMITSVSTPRQAYYVIQSQYNEKCSFVVVEHESKDDSDNSYKVINSEEKLMRFRNEVVKPRQKTLK